MARRELLVMKGERMPLIHILRRTADTYLDLWCPYCDRITEFGHQNYYDDLWCTERDCDFEFPREFWPAGLDVETGELIKEKDATNLCRCKGPHIASKDFCTVCGKDIR